MSATVSGGLVAAALPGSCLDNSDHDVWIAAHAAESGSHLLTYDTHFANVPGILLWQ